MFQNNNNDNELIITMLFRKIVQEINDIDVYRSTTFSLIIYGHVSRNCSWDVGVELDILSMMSHSCLKIYILM